MKTITVLLFLISFSAFSEQCPSSQFPDKVLLKSKTESFTYKYEFVLRCGKIYERKIGGEYSWRLYNKTGIVNPAPEAKIVEISADGENLIAIGSDNTIYYTKIYSQDEKRKEWTIKWGFPKKSTQLPEYLDFAISHRAIPYEDINGNQIPTGTGVTSAFVISDDGKHLIYGDPFLPGFRQHLSLPKEGRFKVAHMMASGSTIFLIDQWGRMYTRLVDFDIKGSNPADKIAGIVGFNPCIDGFGALFNKEQRTPFANNVNGWIRSLPSEPWQFHQKPEDDGCKLTTRITIAQGTESYRDSYNDARELRVGATCNGENGYFTKNISEDNWSFIADNELQFEQSDYQEDATRAKWAEVIAQTYKGTFRFRNKTIDVELTSFHPENELTPIIFSYNDEILTGTLAYREGFFGNKDMDNSKFKSYIIFEDEPQGEILSKLKKRLEHRKGMVQDFKLRFKKGKVHLRFNLFKKVVLRAEE